MLISGISQLINDGRTIDLNNPRVLEVVLRGQIEIIRVYGRMLVQIGLPEDDLQLPATNLELLKILEELIRVQSPLQIEKIMKSLQRARVLAEEEVESNPRAPLTSLSSDGSGVRG